MSHMWKRFNDFEGFVEEFRKYVDNYFTKRIILVNRIKIDEYDNGEVLLYQLDTPSTDIWLKIYKPDLIILDSYLAMVFEDGTHDVAVHEEWNGQKISEEQFLAFDKTFRKALDYYLSHKEEFKNARSEAFINLILATKGEIIDVMEKELGRDITLQVITKELGLNKNK